MSALETVQCPVLVGRDEILALAERRLTETAHGNGRTLLLAGEAGIGKSRVMGAIRRQARATGFREILAEIAPQDHDVPAALLLDLARTMRDTPALADVGEAILDRWSAAISEGGATYSRAFVLDVVDRIRSAIDAPTVLVFEDLQWADDLSLEAIGELARRAGSMPLFVLAAYRRDETLPGTPLRDWRSRLLTQRLAEEVRLERLDLAQTATVTTLLLATGLPAPAEVVKEVHQRSDGVPLHIEELFAAVRLAGAIDASAIRDVPVPDSIEDAVLARLARRSPDAQAVARAGAVIGRCFVPEVLAGVMDRPVTELAGPLQELVDHAFLHSFGTVDDGYYDFRHQLLRDALYRSTPDADLRRYHARAGEFGGALIGATQVHASFHYERAGRREAAYRAALAGAAEAVRLSAHREAFGLYQRAVANMPADLPDLERGELLEHLSDEAGAIERNDVAEDAARRAAEAYRAAGRPDRALFVFGAILTIWRRMGAPLRERRALAEGILADFEALPSGEMRDEGLRWTRQDLLIIQVDAMELDAALTSAADVGAAARAADDHGMELAVGLRVAMAMVLGGDPDGGLASMRAIADEARDARYEETGVTAYRDTALHAGRALDYAEAERCLGIGREYADSIQQSHCAHVMGACRRRSTGLRVAGTCHPRRRADHRGSWLRSSPGDGRLVARRRPAGTGRGRTRPRGPHRVPGIRRPQRAARVAAAATLGAGRARARGRRSGGGGPLVRGGAGPRHRARGSHRPRAVRRDRRPGLPGERPPGRGAALAGRL